MVSKNTALQLVQTISDPDSGCFVFQTSHPFIEMGQVSDFIHKQKTSYFIKSYCNYSVTEIQTIICNQFLTHAVNLAVTGTPAIGSRIPLIDKRNSADKALFLCLNFLFLWRRVRESRKARRFLCSGSLNPAYAVALLRETKGGSLQNLTKKTVMQVHTSDDFIGIIGPSLAVIHLPDIFAGHLVFIKVPPMRLPTPMNDTLGVSDGQQGKEAA